MCRGSILNEAVAQVQLPQCGHPLDALESEGGKCGQPITHSFPSSFLGKSPWKTMAEEAVEVSREMLFRSNGPIQGQISLVQQPRWGLGDNSHYRLHYYVPAHVSVRQRRAEPRQ